MNLPSGKRLRSICIPISIVLISAVIVLLAVICLSTSYSKYNYTFDYTDRIQVDLPAECFLKSGHSPLYIPEYPDVPPRSVIAIYSMKNSKLNPHTFFTDVIIRTSFT